jgi:Fe-S-cluster-containing dehydrogenase component
MMPRNLESVLVPCPACGRIVEFFTDEPKRTCRCGKVLLRESLPRCAEWCPAAALCLGEAVDVRELERKLSQVKDDPRAKQCLESIRQRFMDKGKGDAGAKKSK